LKLLTGPLWFNTNIQDFNVGEVIFKSTFSPDMTGSLEHDGNLLKCKSNIKAALGRKAIDSSREVFRSEKQNC
jgi:hypothetical protein